MSDRDAGTRIDYVAAKVIPQMRVSERPISSRRRARPALTWPGRFPYKLDHFEIFCAALRRAGLAGAGAEGSVLLPKRVPERDPGGATTET